MLLEVSTQELNLLVFSISNAYVLARECQWFTGAIFWLDYVSFLCWNTLFCASVVGPCCSSQP